MLHAGMSPKRIGRELGISWRSVESMIYTAAKRIGDTAHRPQLALAFYIERKGRSYTPSKFRTFRENLPPSPRQLEVVRLVHAGYRYHEIGRQLGISEKTVKQHIANVVSRIGGHGNPQVVVTRWYERHHAPRDDIDGSVA